MFDSTMLIWIQSAGSLLSAIAAALAWIAKIRWSNQFRAAKEAQIEALEAHARQLEAAREAQIQSKDAEIAVLQQRLHTLTQLDSKKLRDGWIATKEGLEDQIRELERYIEQIEAQLAEAEDTVEELHSKRQMTVAQLQTQKQAKERLRVERDQLESLLAQVREHTVPPIVVGLDQPREPVDPLIVELEAAVASTASASGTLTTLLEEEYPERDFTEPKAPILRILSPHDVLSIGNDDSTALSADEAGEPE